MKKIFLGIALVVVVTIAYFLIAPAFTNQEVNDALPGETMAEGEMSRIIASMPDQPMDEPRPARITTVPSAEPTIAKPETFTIIDTPGHPATGEVRIVETGEKTYVRFESYNGTNGPDLLVYLATDLEATEFVSLGRSKGNQGNANYLVPEDVNIEDYKYVMTWCRAFGVLFDYAEISQ